MAQHGRHTLQENIWQWHLKMLNGRRFLFVPRTSCMFTAHMDEGQGLLCMHLSATQGTRYSMHVIRAVRLRMALLKPVRRWTFFNHTVRSPETHSLDSSSSGSVEAKNALPKQPASRCEKHPFATKVYNFPKALKESKMRVLVGLIYRLACV